MPTSVNDNYKVKLEDIGDERASAEPVKLDAVEQAMVQLAILFKTTGEKELQLRQAIDTGKLADSIQFTDVEYNGVAYSLDIKVLDYYKFINSGVKGTKNKSIDSPFSFRNNYVSAPMLLAIRKWIIRHGLKASTKEARRHPLGTERKALKLENNSNAMAYAVAVGIKMHGIKPTHFWDKAADVTGKEMEKTLGTAFSVSIITEIMK